MSSRGKARKRALDVLYQADLRGEPAVVILANEERLRAADGQALNPFASEIVRGVAANASTIDAEITAHSVGWSIDRMPAVDRAILRIACFELLSGSGTLIPSPGSPSPGSPSPGSPPPAPAPVVIAEAVRLASELSTDESAGFVNGVLAAIAKDLPRSATAANASATEATTA